MPRNLGKSIARLSASWLSQKPTSRLLGLDIPFSDSAIEQDSQAQIALHLAAMPTMVRETYLLYTVDQMTINEIAHRLALPRREVVRNLRRAARYLLGYRGRIAA